MLAFVATPLDGQILVRVRAASLNLPDRLLTQGLLYQLKQLLPFVPRSDFAGEVARTDGVGHFREDDPVVGLTRLGGLAVILQP